MCQNEFNFLQFAAELDIRKDPCDKFKAANTGIDVKSEYTK